MILECSICQKQNREPNWEDAVDHHLYSLDPLTSLSVDTLGPLKEDESGNCFSGQYFETGWTISGPKHDVQEFFRTLLQWVSIFGGSKRDMHRWRLSSYKSAIIGLMFLLRYHHLVVVVYHPQANVVERRN